MLNIEPSSSAQPPSESRFLTLPAELRNSIYRLVLVKDEPIQILASGYETESLLHISTTVRREALKIYFYENRFAISTPRYNPIANVKWFQHVQDLCLKVDMRTIEERKNIPNYDGVTWWNLRRHGSDRDPHWRNLLEWMRFVHAGKVIGSLTKPMEYYMMRKTSRRSLIIKGLFATAEDLKDQPWEAVEKIVSHQRPALATLDDRWLEDEELCEGLRHLSL